MHHRFIPSEADRDKIEAARKGEGETTKGGETETEAKAKATKQAETEAKAEATKEPDEPKRGPGRPKGSGKKKPSRTELERQRDLASLQQRKDKLQERDKRNRALVKAMGLVDEKGRILEPGKRKTRLQQANEARLELQQQIMDLHAGGWTKLDIATHLDLPQQHVNAIVDQALANIAKTQASATAADHFAKYAFFTMRQIQRLDRLIDQFLNDPEAKQYNATVTAERARSDLLDKVYRMGERLGVMKLGKVTDEVGRSGTELVQALVTERRRLDEVIAELECTVERKTLTARVKRAPQDGKQTERGDRRVVDAELGRPQRVSVLDEETGEELSAELERERRK